jgi:hypothetical protein
MLTGDPDRSDPSHRSGSRHLGALGQLRFRS